MRRRGRKQDRDRAADLSFARPYLPADTQMALSLDLDYDGPQWLVIKQAYARVARTGALRDLVGAPVVPPTLDGVLNLATQSIGVSFTDDVKPLLGGRLVVGLAVTPAPALSAASRRIVERVDQNATRFDEAGGSEVYVDRSGHRIRDLSDAEIQGALDEQAQRHAAYRMSLVYRVRDRKALDRLLRKLEQQGLQRKPMNGVKDVEILADGLALVGGDTLVSTLETRGTESLRRTLTGPGTKAAVLSEGRGLLDVRLGPGALGSLMDRDELTRTLATPAGRALRSVTASVTLKEGRAVGDARVDFQGLPAAALPLPAPKPLDVPSGVGLASGSADQSLTTVFLARLVRAVYPRSAFVRAVERLEADMGITFEDGVLAQFSGPSQSLLIPGSDGTTQFAARSTLRDPAAMRKLLPKLAPRLPAILDGLNGLGATGLAGLLLVAPDAPLTPASAAILGTVTVRPLAGGNGGSANPGSELLYTVAGLDAAPSVTGRGDVVYGMIGDVFVVAGSPALARRVAGIATTSTAPAGTRLRFDIARLAAEAKLPDRDARLLRALVKDGEVQASAQDGDIVAHAQVRLGD